MESASEASGLCEGLWVCVGIRVCVCVCVWGGGGGGGVSVCVRTCVCVCACMCTCVYVPACWAAFILVELLGGLTHLFLH